jgi:hypothetical protein
MKKVIIACSVMFIVSCSAMDTIKLTAAHVVGKYCSVPAAGRHMIRKDLDESLSPHSIRVTCGE